jgi:hypothetical protein
VISTRILYPRRHGGRHAEGMVTEWCSLKTALLTKSFGMNDKSAFTVKACKLAPFEWARTYLDEWPAIQWVALRLGGLSCSASGCEHSWSTEGWVHSKKRNRLDQNKVQRLVRAHSNLLLERKLHEWRPKSLPKLGNRHGNSHGRVR